MKTKVCTKCKEIKTVDLFSKRSASKDGLKDQCKFCDKNYQKKYRNSDKWKDYHKEYTQSDKCKESSKKYRQSDKFKASLKKYRQSDKGKANLKKYKESDKFKAYHKEYRKSESDKFKAYDKEYRESDIGKANNKKYKESDKGKESKKKWFEKYMKSDTYFKNQLTAKGFKTKDITQDLIDQQRQIIEVNRLITKINKYETSK